jgi:hypothetical protein
MKSILLSLCVFFSSFSLFSQVWEFQCSNSNESITVNITDVDNDGVIDGNCDYLYAYILACSDNEEFMEFIYPSFLEDLVGTGCPDFDPNWEIEEVQCEQDLDNDGICEDHCEEMLMTVVVDCECSFFNPNTYTVFFTTVYEESCELWEDCSCQCYNDSDGDGICDEDETEGINGCSDSEACNYDDSIIPGGFNDGSCEYPGDECEGFDQQLQELVYGYLEENCECALPLSIDVFLKNKKIIKTVDGFGRETNNNKGFQLHIYNDGTVERKYILK